MSDLQRPSDAFLLFFKGLARHGPGTEEATRRALAACELPEEPLVYDLGAGTGASTLVLAEQLRVPIVAVDMLAQSLDELRTRAERRGLAELVETVEGNFLELDLELELTPGSVDLIWCEGSIYSAGWERALAAWRPLLREGGYLVVSDAVWTSDDRPAEAVELWREYPGMTTAPAIQALAAAAGFELVHSFELEARGWADYYGPLAHRVAFVQTRGAAAVMQEVAAAVEREIAVWEEHGEAVGYLFFVLRVPKPGE